MSSRFAAPIKATPYVPDEHDARRKPAPERVDHLAEAAVVVEPAEDEAGAISQLLPPRSEERIIAAIVGGGCLLTFWMLLMIEMPKAFAAVAEAGHAPFMADTLHLLVIAAIVLATAGVIGVGVALTTWALRR